MTVTSFAELGLRPELLRAMDEAGYTTPTPIQVQAIPVILAGKDIMGGAQTGTGKTAGFALPILQKLSPMANTSPSPARHPVRALILTPTRELAVQVEESFRTYGKYTNLRSTVVYGGVDIKQQLASCAAASRSSSPRRPPARPHRAEERLPGPGRDLRARRSRPDAGHGLHPRHQADHGAPARTSKRQNLLFSATFSKEIKQLADQLLNAPQLIEVARRNTAADTVTQSALQAARRPKRALLEHLVRSRTSRRCCVSCAPSTARRASRASSRRTGSSPTRSMATRRSRRAWKHLRLSRRASCRCWSRPTSPRAASTSTTCRWSSTTSCRTCRKITFTGSAAPAALARPARRSRSSHRKRSSYLADIERMLKRTIAATSPEGFDISANRDERPARAPRGRSADAASRGRSTEAAPRAARARAPRGTPGPKPVAGSAEGVARHREITIGDAPHAPARTETRREERDRAYALNPDQAPAPRAEPVAAESKSALTQSGTARRPSFGHGRPVPALLMKRTRHEPEKV